MDIEKMIKGTEGFSIKLLSDRIYKVIREKIIYGEFSPGEHIVELEIAKMFSTSQAPVREAFSRLQKEGLLVSIPYKGNFVYQLDEEEVKEIFRLRYMVEKMAVEAMFERWDNKHSQALHEIMIKMDDAARSNMLTDTVEADLAFHRYICCNASDYNNIINAWEMWVGKISLLITNYDKKLVEDESLDITLQHHRAIYDAFNSGDKDVLLNAFEQHWSLILSSNLQTDQ